MAKRRTNSNSAAVRIAVPTVVKKEGFTHEYAPEELFNTKEECELHWATWVFNSFVSEFTYSGEFCPDRFLEETKENFLIRQALSILSRDPQ